VIEAEWFSVRCHPGSGVIKLNGAVVAENNGSSFTFLANPLNPDVFTDFWIFFGGRCRQFANRFINTIGGLAAPASLAFRAAATAVGDLQITTLTTGVNPDPDGYTVTVDESESTLRWQSLGTSETTVLSSIPAGPREIELVDVASNCTASGYSPRKVDVSDGELSTVSFDVSCGVSAAREGQLAFLGVDAGSYSLHTDIYTVNVDGSELVNLTDDAALRSGLEWSPDGSLIAFVKSSSDASHDDLYVMNGDGTGLRNLTQNLSDISEDLSIHPPLAWSPDGSQILFEARLGVLWQDLYLANVDGSGLRNLTDTPSGPEMSPAWSPDGTQIAFASPSNGVNLYLMNTDGVLLAKLTNFGNPGDPSPKGRIEWSPDGSKLLFESGSWNKDEIYVVNVDGTGLVNLTNAVCDRSCDPSDRYPTWSPDGLQIAFARAGYSSFGIYVIDADGTGARRVTTEGGINPVWSPDGLRIAFLSLRDAAPAYRVYVTDRLGSWATRVTSQWANPEGSDRTAAPPRWRP
jgi:Tol biopolymer transport system component